MTEGGLLANSPFSFITKFHYFMAILNSEYDVVYIIDCLSEDERERFQIAETLYAFLKNQRFGVAHWVCHKPAGIFEAFEKLKERAKEGQNFCIQVVSHGTMNGLLFKGKKVDSEVTWDELRPHFYEINGLLSNKLIVNMTTCFGFYGLEMVDKYLGGAPFFGLIGAKRKLFDDEIMIVNSGFYGRLILEEDIKDIIPKIQDDLRSGGYPDDAVFGKTSQDYKRE